MMQDNKVSLKLLLQHESFSFGEPINPQLRISNDSGRDVQLSREFVFDAERLGFAGSNAVRLVGPDGTNSAAAYRRNAAWFKNNPSIRLPAGDDIWMCLPIHAHLLLRQQGRYEFQVNLADESDMTYESNRIEFRLEHVPAANSTAPLSLELRPESNDMRVSAVELESQSVRIDAEFKNSAAVPLDVLRPQDDSYAGWVNPVYRFTVTDSAGRQLALSARCGTMAVPVYGKHSFVRVEPNATHREKLRFPLMPEMLRHSDYRVRLTYLVRDRAIGKGGTILDKATDWEADVFVGCVESNEINLKVAG